MAYRSLTLAAFACLALAGAAHAGSYTECRGAWIAGGNGWGKKHYYYKCESTSESRYATTRTECASGPIDSACRTTSQAKPQPRPPQPPRPILEPTAEVDRHTGMVIMRGMPDR